MMTSDTKFNYSNRTIAIALTVLCILMVLPFIGIYDFNTKGEPREAVVAMSMLNSGNWILPVNNGVDLAFKPPFFHWCIAAFSLLLGGVSEFSSRLPSAIAFIITVVSTFVFFAKRSDQKTGLIAAFITLTSFELHRAGFNCRVDMVLTACTVCAIYQLYAWYERGLKGMPWLAILCMSLGTLTKGPVGIIIPCLAAGIFMLVQRVNFWKLLLRGLLVIILSMILPACWYYAAYRQGGDNFLYLVMQENVGRMTNSMTEEVHSQPWYYNIITIISGFIPWTLLMLVSLPALKGVKRINVKQAILSWSPLTRFVVITIVATLVFYTIPDCKRSTYLMPVYPFIAFLMARYILWLASNRAGIIRIYGHILAVLSFIVLTAFIVIKCGLLPDNMFSGKHAADNQAMLDALAAIWNPFTIFFICLPAIASVLWWNRRSALVKGIAGIVILTCSIQLMQDGGIQPVVLQQKSDKSMAQAIAAIVPQGKIYSFVSANLNTKDNKLRFFSIDFYTNDRLTDFLTLKPQSGYLLIGDDDAKDFLGKFSQEDNYTFKLRYKGYKKTCDRGQIPCLYQFLKTRN